MSVLAEYNYPTIQAQERLDDVMFDNGCESIPVRDIQSHKNGLVTFDADIGGNWERHVLTPDDVIYMYWEYQMHFGLTSCDPFE